METTNQAEVKRYEGQSKLTFNPKTEKHFEKKPSIRMRKAFKALISGEAKTDKEALLMGGYSEGTAKRNANVIQTKAWQKLLDEYLSEEELTRKHNQLLNSKNENIAIKAVALGYDITGKRKISDNNETKVLNVTNILNILQSNGEI